MPIRLPAVATGIGTGAGGGDGEGEASSLLSYGTGDVGNVRGGGETDGSSIQDEDGEVEASEAVSESAEGRHVGAAEVVGVLGTTAWTGVVVNDGVTREVVGEVTVEAGVASGVRLVLRRTAQRKIEPNAAETRSASMVAKFRRPRW